MKRTIVLGTVICLAFIFVGAGPLLARPKISWQPQQVALEPTLGLAEEVTVSFEARTNLGLVEPWIVPELASYISVSPAGPQEVRRGEVVTLTLTVLIPEDEIRAALDGTLHIRQARRPRKTIARPLSISIDLISQNWPVIEGSSYIVAYPPSLDASTVAYSLPGFVDGYLFSDPDGVLVAVVTEYEPLTSSSLLQWYLSEVLPNEFSLPQDTSDPVVEFEFRGDPAIEIQSSVNDWITRRIFVDSGNGIVGLLTQYPSHSVEPAEFEEILSSLTVLD